MENLLPVLTATIVAISITSILYSLFLLFRKRAGASFFEPHPPTRTSSIATAPVDPSNFVLGLIAVTVPDLKKLLATPPEAVFLVVTATGPPQEKYEADIIACGAAGENKVTIDLNKRRDLQPLINVLLASGEDVEVQELRETTVGR